MATKTKAHPTKIRQYPRVGDRVVLRLGNDVEGTIVEDRGNIGAKGEHIYRIAVNYGEESMLHYEIPTSGFRSTNEFGVH